MIVTMIDYFSQSKKLVAFCFRHGQKKLLITDLIKVIISTVEPIISLFLTANILTAFSEHSINQGLFAVFRYVVILLLLKVIRIYNASHNAVAINQNNDQEFYYYAKSYAKLPYYEFEKSDVRDLQKRVRVNTHSTYLISEIISGFLTNMFQLLIYISILFNFSSVFSIVVVFSVLFQYFARQKMEAIRLNFMDKTVKDERKLAYVYHVLTDFEWSKEVRLGNFFPILLKKSEKTRQELKKKGTDYKTKIKFSSLFTEMGIFFFSLFQYIYLAVRAFSSKVGVGSFVLVIGSIGNLNQIFQDIVDNLSKWNSAVKKFSEYQEYIELIPKEEKTIEGTDSDEIIEFRDVSFVYPGSKNTALSHISFKIRKNESLAVIGLNGSGKTTLVKLLCRFYKPTTGKIFYKGKDIWSYSTEDWQNFLSIVFQDYQIFSFTVADNIALQLPKNENWMKMTLDDWGLKSKVEKLTNSVNTPISKRFSNEGVELSGGEMQKIAGSRAQYKNSPIFIFDEANSNFDVNAEGKLYESLQKMLEDKISLFISHRMGVCKIAKQIIVLENGKIIQMGTPLELSNQKGPYVELLSKQRSDSEDE